MCFSCVYVVSRHTVSFTATEQIRRRRYILCLSCVYHVLTMCLSCVAFSRQSDIPKILHMTVRPLPYPWPIWKFARRASQSRINTAHMPPNLSCVCLVPFMFLCCVCHVPNLTKALPCLGLQLCYNKHSAIEKIGLCAILLLWTTQDRYRINTL